MASVRPCIMLGGGRACTASAQVGHVPHETGHATAAGRERWSGWVISAAACAQSASVPHAAMAAAAPARAFGV